MKKMLVLLLALSMPVTAAAQTFMATLSGANEVGGGAPSGAGVAVVTISGTQVTYTILVTGVDAPSAAHIHQGDSGVAGNVVLNLAPSFVAGTATGTVAADEATVRAISGNPAGFYVNVHNAQFPDGAVRGQLAGASSGSGALSSFMPVVGKVRGAANTNFVTDLRIVNDGSSTANVTLDFYAQSPEGQTSPTATANIAVAPGEQKVLDDVVGTTLNVSSGLGALRISSDQNILAAARIINDLRAEDLGTAGFAMTAEGEPSSSGTMMFLSSNNDYRTNVGYFNAGSSTVNATFVARRTSDGSALGSQAVAIPARSMVQQGVFSLISDVAAAEQIQDDFYISWTADAPLFVYGAVTDNRTGDVVLNQ